MSVPRFFPRVLDAITPFIGSEGDIQAFLSDTVVALRAPASLARHRAHLEGFLLATNLCARLYPRISIRASRSVTASAIMSARRINPDISIEDPACDSVTAELVWGAPARGPHSIAVSASGWDVLLGGADAQRIHRANVLTCLASAALGVGELFRSVFRASLPSNETLYSNARFNLITGGNEGPSSVSDLSHVVQLGRIALVGAGAIGQGFVYALARIHGIEGILEVYDPERVALSNLQRYVLTGDSDEDASKCALVERELAATSLAVRSHEKQWASRPDAPDTVCLSVDSAMARIAVQASLPRIVYNAWTQPSDLGWSRHETFGVDPCVACLYWPATSRPNYHELIASALKQHPRRVLAYLTSRKPIGEPLLAAEVEDLPDLPKPPDWKNWLESPILDDIATTFPVTNDSMEAWHTQQLTDLYHEGVCGGALLRHANTGVSGDVAVPLAHQSVLAGVMLATELIAACDPDLRGRRSRMIEGRIDILRRMPQEVNRPRQRTPGCLCDDPDFTERYNDKWGVT